MSNLKNNVYYDRINNLSDEELLKAFGLRNEYQAEAKEAIIAVSQERNLVDTNLEVIIKEPNYEEEEEIESVNENREHQVIEPGKRPPIITFICIFGAIFSTVLLLSILLVLLSLDISALINFLTQTLKGVFLLSYVIILLASIVTFVGLWKMRKWAAWSYIVLQIIAILYNLYNQEFVSALVRIAMIGVIIYHSKHYISTASRR